MRFAIAFVALLAPSLALAEKPYSPKFARLQQDPQVLAFELCHKPQYPQSSQRNEETGATTVRFTIAPTGRVLVSAVAHSSGFRDLDKASVAALSRCRFRPATLNGVPVQGTLQVQYVWTLE